MPAAFAVTRGSRMTSLKRYLKRLVTEGLTNPATESLAQQAWRRLDEVFLGDLAIPDAAPGPDGQILFTWDEGEHHSEIEIDTNGDATFFSLNRQTREARESAFNVERLTGEIRERLSIFTSR